MGECRRYANSLLTVTNHCLRSRHYVNVIVASKRDMPQWLSMAGAQIHCTKGIGIWKRSGNDRGAEPDVVLDCCGDTSTLEVLAAVSILREHLPELKIRVVNVVDLRKLQSASEHPHGLSDLDYVSLFTQNKQVSFAFHGYPTLIHRLRPAWAEPAGPFPLCSGRHRQRSTQTQPKWFDIPMITGGRGRDKESSKAGTVPSEFWAV